MNKMEKIIYSFKYSSGNGSRLIPTEDVSTGLSVETIGSYFAPKNYRNLFEFIDISKAINNTKTLNELNSEEFSVNDWNINSNESKKDENYAEYSQSIAEKCKEFILQIDDKLLPIYSCKLRNEYILSKSISKSFLNNEKCTQIIDEILSAAEEDYKLWSKISIIDYIFKNKKVCKMFSIDNNINNNLNIIPEKSLHMKSFFKEVKRYNRNHNHFCHPIIPKILNIWDKSYRNINVLNINFGNPLNISNFKAIIAENCEKMNYNLNYDWISECNHIIVTEFSNLINYDSIENLKLFDTIASFMSRLMRQLVIKNMDKWIDILEDSSTKCLPLFKIEVKCKPSGAPYFMPLVKTWKEILEFPIKQLIHYNNNINRVENRLVLLKKKEFSKRYLFSIQENDFEFQNKVKIISRILEKQNSCQLAIDLLEKEFNENISKTIKEFGDNSQNISTVLNKCKDILMKLILLPNQLNSGIFQIDCRILKHYIKQNIESKVNKLIEIKVFEIKSLAEYIVKDFSEMEMNINKESDSTIEFIDKIKNFEEYKSRINLMQFDVQYIENNWNFIVENGSTLIDDKDFEVFHRLFNISKKILKICNKKEKQFENNRSEIETELKQKINSFQNKLIDFQNILNAFEKKRVSSPLESISDNCQQLTAIDIQLNQCIEESKAILCEQELLEWQTITTFPLLSQLMEQKKPLNAIWITADLFRQRENDWMSQPMYSINMRDVRQSVQQFLSTSSNITNDFKCKSNDIKENVNTLQTNINSFKQNCIPLLEVLSNPVLNDRHWRKISEIIGQQISLDTMKTLKDIICLTNATKHINQIEKLGTIALKEHELELFLEKMRTQWIDDWPEDALEIAGNKFLEGESLEFEVKEKCVKTFKYIHLDSVHFSALIKQREGQTLEPTLCVTPPLFIQLILTFKELLKEKQKQITSQRNRYLNGISKLDLAAKHVLLMKNQLINDFQPLLVTASHETENLMIRIEKETIEIEMTKEIIATDEAIANRAAAFAHQIKDECIKELSQAIPAIKRAIEALNTLKPEDITFLKSMKSPPESVRMVLESVCILKGYKPIRRADPKTFAIVEDYWSVSLRMLSDIKFLDSLKTFDKNHIKRESIALVRQKYLDSHLLEPKALMRVSVACEGLAKWVRAVDIYDRVINVIKPKRKKLMDSERELLEVMEMLNKKKIELQKTCDLLQQLNDEFSAMSKKKKELEENIEFCRMKLFRAKQLVDGLKIEKIRWKDTSDLLNHNNQTVIGDVLLSAATIVYTSALTAKDREFCLNKWQKYFSFESKLLYRQPFSIIKTLGNSHQMRVWIEAGLKANSYGMQNAIIAHNCKTIPVIINRNQFINQWFRRLYPNLIVIDFNNKDDNYLKNSLFNAIKAGEVVIIENVDKIESNVLIMQLIEREIITNNGKQFLKFGDDITEYSESFRVFICSEHSLGMSPKTMSKINLINWLTTESIVGSVDLNNIRVLHNRAEQEMELLEMEDQILQTLSAPNSNVLDDENAIKLLVKYKNLAKHISSLDK